MLKARNKNFSNESCCELEMFFFIVQSKINVNILYFQFTAEICFSTKRSCLYVGLQVTKQNELNFPFDYDHTSKILHM